MATFQEVAAKWKVITGLLRDQSTAGQATIVVDEAAAQALGVVSDPNFVNYLKAFSSNRTNFSNMIANGMAAQATIMTMWKDIVDVSGKGITLVRAVQQYMHDNTLRILSRSITRGVGAVDSNAGNLHVHTVDYLGYEIETGRDVGNWTLNVTGDLHDSTANFFSMTSHLTPDNLDTESDQLTDAAVTFYTGLKAINTKSANLLLSEKFDSFNATTGFTNWYSASWTDVTQETDEFVHERLGTRTSTNPNGLGDSAKIAANTHTMYRYLNNLAFQRFHPYLIKTSYKYLDITSDGTITLHMGSQSQAGLAGGLTAGYTGTFEFNFGGDAKQVKGVGTAYLTEIKPGDTIWNDTNDAIGDGQKVLSVETDTTLTLAVDYAGTAGAGKTGKGMYTGWHEITLIEYLDDFWEDDLKIQLVKAGGAAGAIFYDEVIIKQMNFWTETGRYLEITADQVDFEKGDTITFADVFVGGDSVNQRWFTRYNGVSLPHTVIGTPPEILDPA